MVKRNEWYMVKDVIILVVKVFALFGGGSARV